MIQSRTESDNIIRGLILACELVVLNVALLALFYMYKGDAMMSTPNSKRLLLVMCLVYIAADATCSNRIYERFVRGDKLLWNTFKCLALFTIYSFLVMWTFRWPLLTLKFMLPFYLMIWFSIITFRWIARVVIKWFRHLGRNNISVLYVGDIGIAEALYKQMKNDRTCGYHVLGYYADEERVDITQDGYLGRPKDVLQYIEEHPVHRIFCMLPSSENELINEIITVCDKQMIRYMHIPDSFNYKRHAMALELMDDIPVFSFHNEPLSQLGNRIAKRVFDIVFSSLFLFTLFPIVYIVFGFLIKRSSPGPIFFRQKRNGLDGKDFWCLKFRSMKMNVDSDNLQATKDDPRKTKVGEFMRKTSIDELPQFINVLKGDMSVVGPRPHMLKHTQQYSALISNYMVRHFAKPGITGYAQVTGSRGETQELWQMEERVRKDIWYIEHWSLSLDCFIILKTILNAIKGEKEAY